MTTPDEAKEVPRLIAVAIVLWPALIGGVGAGIGLLAGALGCPVSMVGPRDCPVGGHDMGPFLHEAQGLSILLPLSIFWIPIGLILLGALRARAGRR